MVKGKKGEDLKSINFLGDGSMLKFSQFGMIMKFVSDGSQPELIRKPTGPPILEIRISESIPEVFSLKAQ